MTWFMAGAAAITAGTSIISGTMAANSQAKSLSRASKAEGEAIARERLNKTISNSYSAALMQMNLSLKKRQLAQQKGEVSAATLMARGDAETAAAATGSIGASTDAVIADIESKSDAAKEQINDAFENAIQNYNQELNMMVVNTDQSAPQVREYKYEGPGPGEIVGMGLLQGLTTFASSYATRKMSLGLGQSNVPSQVGGTYQMQSVSPWASIG